MELSIFFKGFIIGLAIAAPVGPIGIMCIRRTLNKGQGIGFISGLGAATADTIYGVIAAFGITFISDFLTRQQVSFRLIGGVFLLGLGVKAFFSRPRERTEDFRNRGFARAYVSILVLTLTNPITAVAFATAFAGFGLGSSIGNYLWATILTCGVFAGSAAWWLFLSSSVSAFSGKFSIKWLVTINRISGVMIFAFGLWLLASLVSPGPALLPLSLLSMKEPPAFRSPASSCWSRCWPTCRPRQPRRPFPH